MDVACPACGARPRTRCFDGRKRTDVSHPERAWKTRPCPACGAAPGEWCKHGPVYTTAIHIARIVDKPLTDAEPDVVEVP